MSGTSKNECKTIAKVHVISDDGISVRGYLNIVSVTKLGTGQVRVIFDAPTVSAGCSRYIQATADSTNNIMVAATFLDAAGQVDISVNTYVSNNGAVDANFFLEVCECKNDTEPTVTDESV
jgi:hypothetical protein